jgi:hypothetical protein
VTGVTDSNLDNFQERIRRIEGADSVSSRASKNKMFMAQNGSAKARKKFRWNLFFVTLVILYIAFAGIKVFIGAKMGQENYDARVLELSQGDQSAQIAAYLMGPGPLTGMFRKLGDKIDASSPK